MARISPRVRVLLIAAAIFAAIAGAVFYLSVRYQTSSVSPVALPPPGTPADAPPAQASATPTAEPSPVISPAESATPDASPSVSATPGASPSATPPPAPAEQPNSAATPAPASAGDAVVGTFTIPVAGIRPEQLQDTFTQSRSEGRTHNAIDIIAPRGTPVVAAADGRVVKLFNSERGGITLYQLDPTGKVVLYYAHLERYADGVQEGKALRRGETIGYVGDTGNAGAGNYHLHFSVWLVTDPKRYWDGINLNPYALLKR